MKDIEKINKILKEIDNIFKISNIYKAKYVYIYSDFRTFFQIYKNRSEDFVDKFLNLFLKKGITCIVPAFSYTTKGSFFVEKTNSHVGFLGNFIIKKRKSSRSEHPVFSFIAIGKNRKIVKKVGKSAFGPDSVHKRLFRKKTFFLNLCRPIKYGNTLVHHIEQMNKANYRFDKVFNTKVYSKKSYIGNNFKAYVRKNMTSDHTRATFKKALKKIKNKNYFFKRRLKKLEILIYPYDSIYNDLDSLFKRDKKIFIKGK